MLSKKLYFLFFILLLLGHRGWSQIDQRVYDLQTVTPPSPDASSLGKYADWAVSLYTGTPEISIPIYTLKGRSISVPIGISYHSSGNKVGEYASCVGLGWSLQAGGVITRSVRGLPDDAGGTTGYLGMRAFYNNPGDLRSGTTIAGYDSLFQKQSVDGNVDTEPDLFMFNAMGRSYKFYFSGNGNIVTQPYSNLKLTFNTTDSSFTAVMEDGTTLLFGGGSNFVELTNCVDFATYNYISSWYLRQVVSPKGEVINFSYVPSEVKQDGYYYESDYTLDQILVNNGSSPPFTNKPGRTKVQNQTINALTLSAVESDLGRVEFNTGSRTDLTGALAVTGIKVYSKFQHRYLQSYVFHYSNSTAASGNSYTVGYTNPGYRMHLDSLTELATDNNAPKQWKFIYYNHNLPAYKSFAQDYWGYYNGQTTNTTLLPYEVQFDNTHAVGNRTPDSVSMMAEMLTQVTYPTGGSSRFSWEPNNYVQNEEVFTNVPVTMDLDLASSKPTFTEVDSSFSITSTQNFSFTLYGTFSSAILGDFGTSAPIATATLKGGEGTTIASLVLHKGDNNTLLTSSVVSLTPGTYTVSITTNVDPSDVFGTNFANMETTFSYSHSLGYQWVENYVGGLRIKSIIYRDNIDTTKDIQKYYTYEQPYLMRTPDPMNDYLSSIIDKTYSCDGGADDNGVLTGPCGAPGCVLYSVQYFCRSSSTKFALGTIQGGAIGYQKVTEQFGASGENGKNVYYYTSEGDLNIPSSLGLPYPAIVSLDYERGLLSEEDTYTAAGALVHKALNTYQFLGRDTITTYKCAYLTNILSSCYNANPFTQLVTRIFYQDLTNQVMHLSTTDITYNTATGDSVQVVTRYDYENPLNMQPTRTAKVDSKGDSVIVYSRTALEKSTINSSISLSGTASATIDSMLARNMVGLPVETERYVGSSLTDKILTNYKVQAAGPLPDNVMVQNRSNPIETRIYFPEYDGYGNLMEQQKSADQRHDYIYAYSGTYPIAEVTNGDSTSIAYTSFETAEGGHWTIGTGSYDTTSGITGRCNYVLNGSISKSGVNTSNIYFVSYWTQGSAFSISGTVAGYPMKGKTILWNGVSWTLYVHKVTGQSTITVSGNGHIDELRLYPATARMVTYTYDPLVGVTTQTDVGNRATYYEYDGFQRLKRVRDQDYNIIKSFEYQYQTPGGCGGGCSIITMQNFAGTNTLSYPVGVFNIHGNLLGNAASADSFVARWNSDTADNRIGTLAKGADSMHFQLTINSGQSAPAGVTGCRYYQYDLPWNSLDCVIFYNGDYVDWGDGTGMRLGATGADTPAVTPPNTNKLFNPYTQTWTFTHSYPDNSLKTLTFYHSDNFKSSVLAEYQTLAGHTYLQNLRGNLPQQNSGIGGSSYQQASALTVSNISNWSSINSITTFQLLAGDLVTPCEHVNYAQDFMQNNRGLNTIITTWTTIGPSYMQAGYRDTTFKLSRLKSNWNTYFTNLQDIEISDEHWNREDLSALTKLKTFILIATNVNHSNDPTGNSLIVIPNDAIDSILNQIEAGAGQNVSNGFIQILSAGGSHRTDASKTAVQLLVNKGWYIYVNGNVD